MENTILTFLRECDDKLFDKIVKTFAFYKKLDFMSISQNDIIMLSPQKAFEYSGDEGDKYFKIWLSGSKIMFVTWANTMIDSQFRWNAKARNNDKRDNRDILGNEPYVTAYLKSNSAIEQCTMVYMFPFEKFVGIHEKVNKQEESDKPKRKSSQKSVGEPIVNTEFTGKQAQAVKVKSITKYIADLKEDAHLVDRWIGDLKGRINNPKKNKEANKWRTPEEDHGRILGQISEVKINVLSIKGLEPNHPLIEYYENKIRDWEITMEELDIKISQMRRSNNSLLGGFIDFINKL
ncbi:MAG: hypothetical protein U0L54_03860 [Bacteroidales bacterium]|nr:hypothetical protein [Bacteroidales bacterium]MEE1094433.1 hypothetical protein [Bacteroidales bacterium]